MDTAPANATVVTQEIRIVDAQGRVRMLLSAANGAPEIVLMRENGAPSARMSLTPDGRPAITLINPAAGPSAALEIDDKGAHLKFDGVGGSSSYVFLSNVGTSGLVLIDPKATRRLSAIVTPEGEGKLEVLDATGKCSLAKPR